YDQKQEEKERNETVFTRMSTRNEQIEKELRNLQKEERERATAIKEWLQAYNEKRDIVLSLHELKQLLTYDRSWIEEERKALQQIREEVNRARTVLEERENAFQKQAKKNVSDESLENLRERLEKLKKEGEEVTKKYHEISAE